MARLRFRIMWRSAERTVQPVVELFIVQRKSAVPERGWRSSAVGCVVHDLSRKTRLSRQQNRRPPRMQWPTDNWHSHRTPDGPGS